MGFLDKVTDPFGVKKKIKKKAKKELKGTFLGNLIEFEDFQLKRWGKMLKENPEQALLGGLTPFGAKAWGEVTGRDYEPFVNMWGGPTQQAFAEAEAAGIDTSDVQTSHKIAEMVASYYAGGALTDLAGQGLQAYGGTGRIGSEAASRYGPMLRKGTATRAAGQYYKPVSRYVSSGLTAGAEAMEDPIDLGALGLMAQRPGTLTVPTIAQGGLMRASRRRRYA